MQSQPPKPKYAYHYPRPMVTVDLVVLTPTAQRLRVLLIRRGKPPFQGQWALPGGFVEMNETIEQAARRELTEETHMRLPRPAKRPNVAGVHVWMEEIRSFSKPNRDPRGRTITVAHLVLIRPDKTPPVRADDDAEAVDWFDLFRPPQLAFDHRHIIRTAIDRLKTDSLHRGLLFRLMPPTFTLTELRQTCEMIFPQGLDWPALNRRIRSLGLIEPIEDRESKRPTARNRRFRYRPI
ncbi:MAG: NUDIX hydrolase [Phycisphaerae bacterium]|nr:NUDIX hydrolase [Phycisphaerae bacterium]